MLDSKPGIVNLNIAKGRSGIGLRTPRLKNLDVGRDILERRPWTHPGN